jgi:4-amino-4-deoxy-L-arabinose transferase-like glycosyltransferase
MLPSNGGGEVEAWITRRARLIAAAACVLLLLECFALIRTRWVEDENWLSSEAWTLAQEGHLRMPLFPADPEYKVEVAFPAYISTLGASFAAFGLGIPQARVISAIFSLGLVVVVFLLAADIGGPLCGAVAAILAATDTFLVVAGRTARPEAEVALFCWLGVLLAYRAAQRRSPALAIAAGTSVGIGLMCHPLAVGFLGAIGLLLCIRCRFRVWKDSLVWLFAIPALAMVGAYLVWCFSDPIHFESFRSVWLNKTGTPLSALVLGELGRWRDFIGLSNQHIILPIPIPVRLHILLILLWAFVMLWRHNRKVAAPALILLAVNLLILTYLVNKGPRYLVVLSPLFAVVLAYAISAVRNSRQRGLAAVAIAAVFLTQLAGDAYWIYKSRGADYPKVARELQQIVAPGSSVYGITTFWLALHDHTYFAYDRTTLPYAVQNLHPDYLILYDRVMMRGSGSGSDDFAELRAQAGDFVRTHATLAGRVSDPFYGDLEVYRVHY